MKTRRMMVIMEAALSCMLLAACGKDTSSLVYLKDFEAKDYVKAGEYKGVTVTLDQPEVTDEELDAYIDSILQSSPVQVPITDRTDVQMGDVANIDYEGKKDGVAFEGGTAKGFDLSIGSGRFIDGFEDGVVGMQVGETKDLNLTFPDPYDNNPDLAGKPVVFTVTVNSISASEIPELTDEYVAGLGLEECADVQEYREFIRGFLLDQEQTQYESDKSALAFEEVVKNAEFEKAPEGMINRMNETLIANLTQEADNYGMELAEYVALAFGGSEDGYRELLLEQSELMAQRFVLIGAIADLEGITVTEEERDAELNEQLEMAARIYGYESADEYKEQLGNLDEEAYREYMLMEKVTAFISDHAVVE